MSPNTLTKFLNSKSARGLNSDNLGLVVRYFGLTDASDLDTDNPLGDPKIAPRKIIDGLSPDDALDLCRELEARFKEEEK
ncbi:hypothetical protein RSK20926_13749 [Roseobacter sp. SK209-2-6]|nr:hypothetical protein RSK20926_13749 [Roseobacter sp. SK209-2-6]